MLPIARVITADPSWLFDDALPGATRGASKQYTCMTARDIARLKIPPVEPDALLFLWRVSSMVSEALDVCRAWGFTPKSEIVWVKLTKGSGERALPKDVTFPAGTRLDAVVDQVFAHHAPLHFGMGRYVRASHETCIVATRGRARGLLKHLGQRSVFFAPVGAHSEKPEAFFRIVEGLSDGPYVELFARRARPGWTCIGSDLGHTLMPLDAAGGSR